MNEVCSTIQVMNIVEAPLCHRCVHMIMKTPFLFQRIGPAGETENCAWCQKHRAIDRYMIMRRVEG